MSFSGTLGSRTTNLIQFRSQFVIRDLNIPLEFSSFISKSTNKFDMIISLPRKWRGRHFKFEPLPKGTTDPMSHTPTKFNFTPLARCPPLALKRMLAFENRKKVRLALVDKYLDNFSQLLHYLSINSLFISLHNSIVDPLIFLQLLSMQKQVLYF